MNHRMAAPGQIFLFLLLFLIVGRGATAQGVTYYRCEVDGNIEFRQTACKTGDETPHHVTNSSSGLTPSEPGVRLKKPSEKTDMVAGKKNPGTNDRSCFRKRHQLDRVERRLRAGYRPSEYQRLHDRQREYEDYIRRFCR
jgi:hypothetical protein